MLWRSGDGLLREYLEEGGREKVGGGVGFGAVDD